MSKKQKLLRKRVEAEKLNLEAVEDDAEDDDGDSKVNVKLKYSVNYFYWAVSDSEEESDDAVETTVVLPLKSLRIQQKST